MKKKKLWQTVQRRGKSVRYKNSDVEANLLATGLSTIRSGTKTATKNQMTPINASIRAIPLALLNPYATVSF